MVTIEDDKPYEVKQGSVLVVNTDHSTPGTIAFALDDSTDYGTAVNLSGGRNVFEYVKGKFKCTGFSGGSFIEFQEVPQR